MKRAAILVMLVLAATLGCNGGGGGGSSSSGTTGTGSNTNTNTTGTNNNTGTVTSSTSNTTNTTTTNTTTSGSTTGIPAIFPPDNPWNQDISTLPVHANSANFIASIGATTGLHPDFGTVYNGAPNGIPFVVVDGATQPTVPINFTAYGSESDPGPYPVPANAPIEGGPSATGDRHVLVIDKTNKKLYEMGNAYPNSTTGGWDCSGGAIFDLASNNLRPIYWTSADAAGLPIFPGLVRYDEAVTAGAINHALRFTVSKTQKGFISPARHWASSNTSASLPPMGLRLRLKASVDISKYTGAAKVILTCLKKYGMFVADNGSNWFISGAPDSSWDDSNLATISAIKGSDFEAVDTGPITTN